MELNLTVPTCWKQLNEKQLIYISWLLVQNSYKAHEIHAFAFVRLTGIKVIFNRKDDSFYCRYKKQNFSLTKEQVTSFSRQFEWITSGVTEVTPIAKLEGRTHEDPRLRGIPFAQYLACENYYQAYIFTKDEKYLNYLIATFYQGNKSFDDHKTIKRAEGFRKLPFHVRHTVFLWFYGLKSVLQKEFPFFFQKVESILEDEEPQAPNMRAQIDNMIRSLTGGDVTKVDAIYKIETWTALSELNAKAKEYQDLERRTKKLK